MTDPCTHKRYMYIHICRRVSLLKLLHKCTHLQVVNLDLQSNKLRTIPGCILQLQSIESLNLSHNNLSEIPNLPEWSFSLRVVDLSYNKLSDLPHSTTALGIKTLNLSHNMFSSVPSCVCSMKTIHSLNLSSNQDILSLPYEMWKLSSLEELNLENIKKLKDPPKRLRNNPQECITYLYNKQTDYLHKLCRNGDVAEMQNLLDSMSVSEVADRVAERRGKNGYTLLHQAVATKKTEALNFLLSKTYSVHVNSRAKYGYTPLHLAASVGATDCVKLLLKHGADINCQCDQNKTPKQLAELGKRKNRLIASVLHSEGN